MSHVWHLVRHDLRAHRGLLCAWLTALMAQPAFALVHWPEEFDRGMTYGIALMLVVARIVLGALSIAAIVQADSPIDDRAFWRTRPIGARRVATAHLITVVSLFVVVPVLAVIALAAAFRLPASQWPWMLCQVVVVELAFTTLGLLVATRTRSAAGFIVGLVVVIGVVLALPFVAAGALRTVLWPFETPLMTQPTHALAATAALSALVAPPLFFLAMAGPRRQHLLVLASLACLAVSTSVWFQPWLFPSSRERAAPRLSAEPRSLRVLDVPGSPGVVALVLDVVPEAGHPGDAWRVTIEEGLLTTPEGSRQLGGGRGIQDLPGIAAPAVSTVITVLGADEHRRLTGARVTLRARVQGSVERRATEGSAAVADGASITTDHARLSITRVSDRGPYRDGSLSLRSQGAELLMQSPLLHRHGHAYVLRDRTTGCEVDLGRSRLDRGRGAMEVALLPTLWQPFVVSRVALGAVRIPSCDLDVTRADIDMRTFAYLQAPQATFALDFTMPAIGEVFTPPSHEARPAQPTASRHSRVARKRGAA